VPFISSQEILELNDLVYQIDNLEHRYGEQIVLEMDSLSIRRGSILGLVGPNGSGKSTLLRLLALVEKPSFGEIVFNGKTGAFSLGSERHRVTLLTQEPYLLKRSVFENVFYGLKIRQDKQDYQKRVHQALSWVGLPPEHFAHRQWYELSGGEAQRVALAARLVLTPKVLLLDEPTANVDAASAILIRDASLRARQEWGTTLIIASHDWSWLYEVCDEVLHLFKGHVIGSGIENVVFGPWQQSSNGHWEKLLGSGQRITVPSPPREDNVAVVSPTAVTIALQMPDNASNDNVLFGVLSRLTLEKTTGDILATITVDDLMFTARLKRHQMQDAPLYPGQKVWVAFHPHSIKWF
jgi:tungstate transport system ATP-binding protein